MFIFDRLKLEHDNVFISVKIDCMNYFKGCKTYLLEWFKYCIDSELKRRYREEKMHNFYRK